MAFSGTQSQKHWIFIVFNLGCGVICSTSTNEAQRSHRATCRLSLVTTRLLLSCFHRMSGRATGAAKQLTDNRRLLCPGAASAFFHARVQRDWRWGLAGSPFNRTRAVCKLRCKAVVIQGLGILCNKQLGVCMQAPLVVAYFLADRPVLRGVVLTSRMQHGLSTCRGADGDLQPGFPYWPGPRLRMMALGLLVP